MSGVTLDAAKVAAQVAAPKKESKKRKISARATESIRKKTKKAKMRRAASTRKMMRKGARKAPKTKQKSSIKRRRKVPGKAIKKYSDGTPIFVVDEHDGTMVATLRAVELGFCPEKFKFFHFDSHPDLGCIPEGDHELMNEMHKGVPSIRKLYKNTDIATWITPMVLMGNCDYVVWACGYWCNQFNPGKWNLLVGKDKNDGRIKIGSKGNKKWSCLDYWESGGSVCKDTDFEFYKEWTLEVVRYGKNMKLPAKQYKSIRDSFAKGPWVLDVDEDFFSCNNPYRDEFRDYFSPEMYKCISVIYDGYDQTEAEDAIKRIYETMAYKKSWKKFEQLEDFEIIYENLQCPPRKKKTWLKMFHAFLRKVFPDGGFEDEEEYEEVDEENTEEKPSDSTSSKSTESEDEKGEEEEEEEDDEADDMEISEEEMDPADLNYEWKVDDFFTMNDLHRVGQLSCLPHHISTADEVKTLVNQVDALLSDLPTPVHVCVATSRLDRYLPDSQASSIHQLVEDLLCRAYDTDHIQRLDKPKFSVDNIAVEDYETIKAKDILDILSEDEDAAKDKK